MTGEPLVVIGIGQNGPEGLGSEAHAHLARAQILAGGKRHLAFFPEFSGQKIILEGGPANWVKKLKARDRQRRTVVLATGDPLFFGIGRLLLNSFPKEELLFLPHVSSVALAFARLKETCNDACVVSLHGRPLEMLLPALERGEPKIAIFTDARNHPAAIARLLRDKGLDNDYALWVCENLGCDQERITRWPPAELTKEDFASLNVVVLLAEPETPARTSREPLPLLGIPNSAIRHRGEPDGLITKREIRLLALCYLELYAGDVLWDIGAGSGSISLEAARISPTLAVFAIEKAPEAIVLVEENLANFALKNIRLVEGEAPEICSDLPDPDAVFVGGNGGRLLAILDHVLQRLKPGGRLVLSCVTLETLSQAWTWLGERLGPRATCVQLAHSRPLGKLHSLEPDKPIFLLHVKKP
jgi:precorrin-6Y C5,15-methyltransferase (decarboxylating)